MKNLSWVFIFLFILPSNIFALDIKPGELFHITGCENGELMVPIVNLWKKPGGLGTGNRVIGKLSGDGRKDQGLKCQGSVVRLLEVKNVHGRDFLKIKSIVNSNVGWVTDGFVGRKFPKSKCKTFFKEKNYQDNCLK